MKKIILINGPNLNLLGNRENNIYGNHSLEEIKKQSEEKSAELNLECFFCQSNNEGELINFIHSVEKEYDGLIINPGGYSHTSIAIRDALEICKLPKIEVHLSNLASRDEFRNKSITAAKTDGYISGFKELSYVAAVYLLIKIREKK